MSLRRLIKKVLAPVAVVLATAYFFLDLVFLVCVQPLARWIAGLPIFPRLRHWLETRDRYTTLALFLIPWALLEPVKPVGCYLIASKHVALGLGVLTVGEIVKLTLFERLYRICRLKLMTFAWFAFCYQYLLRAWNRLQAWAAWQRLRQYLHRARRLVRTGYATVRRWLGRR